MRALRLLPSRPSPRFPGTSRYLVICMNRVHFLNDWMFGFVNVN